MRDLLVDLVVLDQEHARPAHALDIEGEAGLPRSRSPRRSAPSAPMAVSNSMDERHRLDQHVLEAALLGLLQHLLAAIRRHHDEMRRGSRSGSARMRLPVSMPSIAGHPPVDEDDVVGRPCQRPPAAPSRCLLARTPPHRREAQIASSMPDRHGAGLRVVVDDQNAPPAQIRTGQDAPPRRRLVPLPRRAVNQNVLPLPSSLSTPTAAHQLGQRLEIARPSPVPPYLRVVEASACWKAWNSRPICSGVRPMPVSLTAKSRAAGCPCRPPARGPRRRSRPAR